MCDYDNRSDCQGGLRVPGNGWVVGGMAKSVGMLAPAFTTMLVVVSTDAVIDVAETARHCVKQRP